MRKIEQDVSIHDRHPYYDGIIHVMVENGILVNSEPTNEVRWIPLLHIYELSKSERVRKGREVLSPLGSTFHQCSKGTQRTRTRFIVVCNIQKPSGRISNVYSIHIKHNRRT